MEQKSYSPGKTGLAVQEGRREQEGQAVKEEHAVVTEVACMLSTNLAERAAN